MEQPSLAVIEFMPEGPMIAIEIAVARFPHPHGQRVDVAGIADPPIAAEQIWIVVEGASIADFDQIRQCQFMMGCLNRATWRPQLGAAK
jgi:hypothetical protein